MREDLRTKTCKQLESIKVSNEFLSDQSEPDSDLVEIRATLKDLLKRVSEHVRIPKPVRPRASEAVYDQPKISPETPDENPDTEQAVCQPCELEPHTLSFGVSKAVTQKMWQAASELDALTATVWEETLDYERVGLAEVCCASDSVLTNTMLSLGGSARRCSWWNGFGLATRRGAEKLCDALRQQRPRVIWATPPSEAGTTEQSENTERRQRTKRIHRNLCWVLCELYKEGWCDLALERPASCSSWRGVFAELKTQFPWIRTDGCAVGLRDDKTGRPVQKAWHIVCTHERLRTVLGTGGHEHAPCRGKLVTQSGGYTKQMAHVCCKAVLAQKRNEALAAGSAEKRSRQSAEAETRAKRPRSEVVSDTPGEPSEPAANAADPPNRDPADQAAEEAYEPQAVGPRNCPPVLRELSAREFEKAEALVARLHANMGHCSMRAVESALRRRKAHPVLVEMSKFWKCQACEESLRLPAAPVASGWVEIPHKALGMDQFFWTHPAGHVHCRASVMLDLGSRVGLVTVHEQAPRAERLGNTSANEVYSTLTGGWFKYYVR